MKGRDLRSLLIFFKGSYCNMTLNDVLSYIYRKWEREMFYNVVTFL